MAHTSKELATALIAPFEFACDEGEPPIKLNGLELLSVVQHTAAPDIQASCKQVPF